MALGDTHRLIANFRREGYIVTPVRDSTDRLAWDVFYPSIYHNFDLDTNVVSNQLIGKIERYGSHDIGNWSPFGRPFFYLTWVPEALDYDVTKNARRIAENTPRTTVRYQWA